MNSDLAFLQRLDRDPSPGVGLILECARDNAGLDGRHLDSLGAEDLREVVRHVDSIVDGRMVGSATAEDYRRVAELRSGPILA